MSDHADPIAANVLDRQFSAAAPNQRLASDTTEFRIGESQQLYLAVIRHDDRHPLATTAN